MDRTEVRSYKQTISGLVDGVCQQKSQSLSTGGEFGICHRLPGGKDKKTKPSKNTKKTTTETIHTLSGNKRTRIKKREPGSPRKHKSAGDPSVGEAGQTDDGDVGETEDDKLDAKSTENNAETQKRVFMNVGGASDESPRARIGGREQKEPSGRYRRRFWYSPPEAVTPAVQ
ncbi:hypothetical protein EYF80_011265 [Liparis tanakae]|uniref:Uncharacterized protein n=1 Tax=Liparis tanakae TaxID=230148 RepID=A0A4Z2IMP5_9TELE|nr:hypothetical protein EYF80_011265 [Liparis tanakae]